MENVAKRSSQPVKVSSSKIKDAVGSLCKFLNLSGFTHLSAETFRQAKFNKEEAIHPMLILLGELLEFSTSSELPKVFSENENDPIYSLHSKMLAKQYSRPSFYHNLDLTSSRCKSSQELLIAIGWLIGTEDLLKRMVLKDMHRLPFYPNVTHKLEDRRYCVRLIRDSSQTVDVEGRLNQLIWDIGKCQMASKQLHWKQLEIIRLVHKIHSSTHGVSLTKDGFHLSPAEVFVLRFKTELQKHLASLEKENKRLQMYCQWQEREEIFWHWMGSVTLPCTVSGESASPAIQPTSTKPNESLLSGEQSEKLANFHVQLGKTLRKLDGKLQKCGAMVQRLEFESFQGITSEVDGNNCDDEKSREVRNEGLPSHPRCQQKQTDITDVPAHFQFIPKGIHCSPFSKMKDANLYNDLNNKDIKDEIFELTTKLTSLKASLCNQRDVNKDLCDSIFAVVDTVICIPPISSNKM